MVFSLKDKYFKQGIFWSRIRRYSICILENNFRIVSRVVFIIFEIGRSSKMITNRKVVGGGLGQWEIYLACIP
jgi:hypothetical protein